MSAHGWHASHQQHALENQIYIADRTELLPRLVPFTARYLEDTLYSPALLATKPDSAGQASEVAKSCCRALGNHTSVLTEPELLSKAAASTAWRLQASWWV